MENSQIKLIIELTKRDFKIRFLGSLLGMYWNIIHPIVLIAVYTLVFSKIMGAKLAIQQNTPFAYSFYLCAALLPWSAFVETISRGTSILNEQAAFLKKMPFSPIVVFYSSFFTSLVNFLINISIYSIFLLALGNFNITFFLAFLIIAVIFLGLGLCIGITLGCINIYLKDIQQMLSIVFQLWFWFTPIVYVKDHLPSIAQKALYFNPAYPFIDTFHELLFWKRFPTPTTYLLMTIWVLIFGSTAVFVYRRLKDAIRDEL